MTTMSEYIAAQRGEQRGAITRDAQRENEELQREQLKSLEDQIKTSDRTLATTQTKALDMAAGDDGDFTAVPIAMMVAWMSRTEAANGMSLRAEYARWSEALEAPVHTVDLGLTGPDGAITADGAASLGRFLAATPTADGRTGIDAWRDRNGRETGLSAAPSGTDRLSRMTSGNGRTLPPESGGRVLG